MHHIVETAKSFDRASVDLEAAVKRHGFGVLHVHDLGEALRARGVAFDEQCRVYEVCSPMHAAAVLTSDMRLSMALPCRISVFTEKGKTKIGFIEPVQMLSALSRDPALIRTAQEVEEKIVRMVQDAK